jgi:hypothetical protein
MSDGRVQNTLTESRVIPYEVNALYGSRGFRFPPSAFTHLHMGIAEAPLCNMEKDVKAFTTKERYELGNNISSKVLAFAFSLSAEIERSMISSRTKEALARKRSEGKRLGRPKGKLSSVTKLTGKDDLIREYLDRKIPVSAIARLLGVSRLTVRHYIRTRKLQKPVS